MRIMSVALLALLLAGCASGGQLGPNIQAGDAAYAVVPSAQDAAAAAVDYKIGSLDTLDVTVFQEPDLSKKAIQVDASGRLALPLVGSVDAKAKRPPNCRANSNCCSAPNICAIRRSP